MIQFLPFLPESEYEVKKRTFCNGRYLNRDQILLAIRSQYNNLQLQQREGGREKDVGHAFMTGYNREVWRQALFIIGRSWS